MKPTTKRTSVPKPLVTGRSSRIEQREIGTNVPSPRRTRSSSASSMSGRRSMLGDPEEISPRSKRLRERKKRMSLVDENTPLSSADVNSRILRSGHIITTPQKNPPVTRSRSSIKSLNKVLEENQCSLGELPEEDSEEMCKVATPESKNRVSTKSVAGTTEVLTCETIVEETNSQSSEKDVSSESNEQCLSETSKSSLDLGVQKLSSGSSEESVQLGESLSDTDIQETNDKSSDSDETEQQISKRTEEMLEQALEETVESFCAASKQISRPILNSESNRKLEKSCEITIELDNETSEKDSDNSVDSVLKPTCEKTFCERVEQFHTKFTLVSPPVLNSKSKSSHEELVESSDTSGQDSDNSLGSVSKEAYEKKFRDSIEEFYAKFEKVSNNVPGSELQRTFEKSCEITMELGSETSKQDSDHLLDSVTKQTYRKSREKTVESNNEMSDQDTDISLDSELKRMHEKSFRVIVEFCAKSERVSNNVSGSELEKAFRKSHERNMELGTETSKQDSNRTSDIITEPELESSSCESLEVQTNEEPEREKASPRVPKDNEDESLSGSHQKSITERSENGNLKTPEYSFSKTLRPSAIEDIFQTSTPSQKHSCSEEESPVEQPKEFVEDIEMVESHPVENKSNTEGNLFYDLSCSDSKSSSESVEMSEDNLDLSPNQDLKSGTATLSSEEKSECSSKAPISPLENKTVEYVIETTSESSDSPETVHPESDEPEFRKAKTEPAKHELSCSNQCSEDMTEQSSSNGSESTSGSSQSVDEYSGNQSSSQSSESSVSVNKVSDELECSEEILEHSSPDSSTSETTISSQSSVEIPEHSAFLPTNSSSKNPVTPVLVSGENADNCGECKPDSPEKSSEITKVPSDNLESGTSEEVQSNEKDTVEISVEELTEQPIKGETLADMYLKVLHETLNGKHRLSPLIKCPKPDEVSSVSLPSKLQFDESPVKVVDAVSPVHTRRNSEVAAPKTLEPQTTDNEALIKPDMTENEDLQATESPELTTKTEVMLQQSPSPVKPELNKLETLSESHSENEQEKHKIDKDVCESEIDNCKKLSTEEEFETDEESISKQPVKINKKIPKANSNAKKTLSRLEMVHTKIRKKLQRNHQNLSSVSHMIVKPLRQRDNQSKKKVKNVPKSSSVKDFKIIPIAKSVCSTDEFKVLPQAEKPKVNPLKRKIEAEEPVKQKYVPWWMQKEKENKESTNVDYSQASSKSSALNSELSSPVLGIELHRVKISNISENATFGEFWKLFSGLRVINSTLNPANRVCIMSFRSAFYVEKCLKLNDTLLHDKRIRIKRMHSEDQLLNRKGEYENKNFGSYSLPQECVFKPNGSALTKEKAESSSNQKNNFTNS